MFYQFSHHASGDYFVKEYGENFSFPPHLHMCFEFITVLSGEMNITVDRREYTLTCGEAMLIFPNQLHQIRSEKSRHLLCIFSPTLVQAYSAKTEKLIPKSAVFIPDPFLISTLDSMHEDSKSFYKKGLLYSLCAQFDSCAEYTAKETGRGDLLSDIFDFVERSFDKQCSLGELSRDIGYDYAYLSRYFKKATGISFIEYLNQYRLNYACHLLENSELSVLECAMSSGFTSLPSFNRNFKNRYDTTPQKYRSKSRESGEDQKKIEKK